MQLLLITSNESGAWEYRVSIYTCQGPLLCSDSCFFFFLFQSGSEERSWAQMWLQCYLLEQVFAGCTAFQVHVISNIITCTLKFRSWWTKKTNNKQHILQPRFQSRNFPTGLSAFGGAFPPLRPGSKLISSDIIQLTRSPCLGKYIPKVHEFWRYCLQHRIGWVAFNFNFFF